MKFKSVIVKPFAKYTARQIQKWSKQALIAQENTFQELVQKGRQTVFGKDHHFDSINNYDAFKANVPIRDYEGLKPYVERIKNGETEYFMAWKT